MKKPNKREIMRLIRAKEKAIKKWEKDIEFDKSMIRKEKKDIEKLKRMLRR